MFTSPGNIAISCEYFTIYWYGIILAIAFIVGLFTVVTIAKKEYKDEKIVNNVFEIAFWVLLCGILGARLYYVILCANYYSSHLLEIFMIQNGGLSIQGGLIGGILGGLIYCKKHKLSFLQYADLYAFGLPVAQAIGRWGNFFNSEAFGLPTTLPWGVFIPQQNRPYAYEFSEFFHPTFLYESLWNILVFLILYFIIRKDFFNKKGIIFFSYLFLYSLGRMYIETIRIDSVLNIFNVPVAMWVCFITMLISYVAIKKLNSDKELT